MGNAIISPKGWEKWVEGCVLIVAMGVAAVSARPYAGSWNDGSRLAAIESLVDRHSWIIDESIFVDVPRLEEASAPRPYNPRETVLLEHGTLDKLFIAGHYYSDKSPVPALLMAGGYQLWQWTTGWTARTHPDRFCWMMTLASSGLAYVLAVWCLYRLGRRLGLSLSLRLLLTISFALATVALPYAQHVNNHILLLAAASGIALGVAGLREDRFSWGRFAGLGFLAGLAYTIDLGAGPVILLCTFLFILAGRAATVRERFGSAPLRSRLFLPLADMRRFVGTGIDFLPDRYCPVNDGLLRSTWLTLPRAVRSPPRSPAPGPKSSR